VSDLLEAEAVVRSGRELTYSLGKDTGRYWDSSAANVQWIIATDAQVEAGIKNALDDVSAPGVFIEGNSFTKFIEPDYFIMVVRSDDLKIKATAKEALSRVSAFYVSGEPQTGDKERLCSLLREQGLGIGTRELEIFGQSDLNRLIASLRLLDSSLAA
jgi:hypothetical protein